MAVFRDRPNAIPDNLGGGGPSRAGRYGETYDAPLTSKELFAADEGSYFVAPNPTAGTGIIGPVATTFVETTPLLAIYNGGANRIYPQRVQLWVTVIGVGGTRQNYTHTIDTGNRVTSGGTALTKANVNYDSSVSSGATVTFGAITASAATSSRRLLGNHQVREAAIEVVGDQYTFVYGGAGDANSSSSRVATVADVMIAMPPVVIGPGHTYLLYHWRALITTGVTFEVNVEWIER